MNDKLYGIRPVLVDYDDDLDNLTTDFISYLAMMKALVNDLRRNAITAPFVACDVSFMAATS
jgi:hypothetical protein